MISFLKNTWNQVSGFAMVVAVLLTRFVVPPVFSTIIFQGETDYQALSKFIIAGVIILCLVPCRLFDKRKYMWTWWILAFISFVASLFCYFHYNNLMNEKTGFNKMEQRRQVIGDHLKPWAQKSIDSVKKHTLNGDTVTADMILTHLGDAEDNWPVPEIAANAQKIIYAFMINCIAFTLFIMFSIQASFCSSKSKARQPVAR